MATTEEQIKKIISQYGGRATKRQMVKELKFSLAYVDFVCQSLLRKGKIIFLDGLYSIKASTSAIASDKTYHTSGEKQEKTQNLKNEIKTATVPKSKKYFRQTKKLSRQKISKPKKSTKSSVLKKKPGYKTIQFQVKFPFIKLVFIPYKRKGVAT